MVIVLLQLVPPPWRELLLFDRAALSEGELWRLFTAHFVHLSWPHLAYNALALLALGHLYGNSVATRHWLYLFPLLTLGVTSAIWWQSQAVEWYAGFSGILVGLFAGGALLTFSEQRLINTVVLMAISAKILLEQMAGESIVTSRLSTVPTVVDAHLYGAIIAIGFSGTILAIKRVRSRSEPGYPSAP